MNNGLKKLLALVVAAGLALLGWYTYFDWHKAGGPGPMGGDDQPPIIIGDGSVQLVSVGTWTSGGNGNFYISDSGSKASASKLLGVVVGSTTAGCLAFDVNKLTLTGGNGSDSDTYTVDFLGNSGKVKVSVGSSTAKVSLDGHVLDLYKSDPWWLTTVDSGNGKPCAFEKTSKPIVLIEPH